MRTTVLRPSALACALLLSACTADQTTSPAVVSAANEYRAPEITDAGHASEAVVVSRAAPLWLNLTASKIIGAAGGTISLPAAGVTISIPAGALTANTEISISARPGSAVAYDIKPYGLVFARPVVFSQSLLNTDANRSGLTLTAQGRNATPSVSLSGTVNDETNTFETTVSRASGYIMSCGRQERAAEEEM